VTGVSDAAKFLSAEDTQYLPQLRRSLRLSFYVADIPTLAEDLGSEVPGNTAVRAAIGVDVYGPSRSRVRTVLVHRSAAQRLELRCGRAYIERAKRAIFIENVVDRIFTAPHGAAR
jgi:hypothetical protein